MKKILHILTKPGDSWSREMSRIQLAASKDQVSCVVDLTTGEPDYDLLLDRVLEADTVVVW